MTDAGLAKIEEAKQNGRWEGFAPKMAMGDEIAENARETQERPAAGSLLISKANSRYLETGADVQPPRFADGHSDLLGRSRKLHPAVHQLS